MSTAIQPITNNQLRVRWNIRRGSDSRPYTCQLCLTTDRGGVAEHGIGECATMCDCLFGDVSGLCPTCKGSGSPEVVRIPTISLWQPWAEAIMRGYKEWETRPIRWKHLGPIAIHAALRPLPGTLLTVDSGKRNLMSALGLCGDLPRGGVVGIVNVLRCLPTEEVVGTISPQERALGNYAAGRWASQLEFVREFTPMIPVVGRQGWFWTEVNRRALVAPPPRAKPITN